MAKKLRSRVAKKIKRKPKGVTQYYHGTTHKKARRILFGGMENVHGYRTPQFTVTSNLHEAKSYGSHVVRIVIPKGKEKKFFGAKRRVGGNTQYTLRKGSINPKYLR